MILEQDYQFYIEVLFIELVIVSIIAVSLFVALVVTIRKWDNEKHTSAR